MGLFSKKVCSVCGGDAGRVFTRKLDDGILCKTCANKLSPWFNERRSSTVAQIEEQLAYREANKEQVAAFSVTKTLNGMYKVLLDEDAGKFIVTDESKWRESNPDVLSFSDVTGCSYEIKESKYDVTPTPPSQENEDGTPARPQPVYYEGRMLRPGERVYKYDYDFYITINVNNPYFDEISFQVNERNIDSKIGGEYASTLQMCEDIKATLTQVREDNRAAVVAAAQPKQAKKCPYCGATTIPDASGCCEYCGGAVGA